MIILLSVAYKTDHDQLFCPKHIWINDKQGNPGLHKVFYICDGFINFSKTLILFSKKKLLNVIDISSGITIKNEVLKYLKWNFIT